MAIAFFYCGTDTQLLKYGQPIGFDTQVVYTLNTECSGQPNILPHQYRSNVEMESIWRVLMPAVEYVV